MNTNISRVGLGKLLIFVGWTSLVSQPPVFAQTGQVEVSANANIYGAGHASAPAPAGGGAGILPPSFSFTGGAILTFQVSGQVSYNGGGNFYTADGLIGNATQMNALGGISGINCNSSMFLVGVFVGDKEPSGTPPINLNLPDFGFAELSPLMNQTFFIGDGLTGTGTGSVQRFNVPSGATRLFLGFADGANFTGSPGSYLDDVGSLQVAYTLTKLGPVILTQPQNIEVKLGATANLFVKASGKGNLFYQWRFNGARITGSTLTNLVLANFTALDEGDYTVQITDDIGTVLSNPARLTIFRDSDGDGLSDNFEKGVGRYELVKGGFTWQEAKADAEKRGGHLATIISQKEWDSIVAVMGNFYEGKSVFIGGTDAVKEGNWQWVTGEPWNFTRWSSGEPNNSSDEDYLHIYASGLWNDHNVQYSLAHYLLERGFYTDPNNADTDGDGFSDGVEYEAGSIPTDPNSRPLPRIVAQPQGTNVIVGSSFTLAVAANGYGPLAYQWRLEGKPVNGATNAAFSVQNAQHAIAGKYDVILRNGGGSLASATIVVKVTPVLEVERLNNGFMIIQLLDIRPLGWRVESSADLKTWQALGPMTFNDGLAVFLDATVAGKPLRFYRVVAP